MSFTSSVNSLSPSNSVDDLLFLLEEEIVEKEPEKKEPEKKELGEIKKEKWKRIFNEGLNSEDFLHYENPDQQNLILRIAIYICPLRFSQTKKTYLCVNTKEQNVVKFQAILDEHHKDVGIEKVSTLYTEKGEAAFCLAKEREDFEKVETKKLFHDFLLTLANSTLITDGCVPLSVIREMQAKIDGRSELEPPQDEEMDLEELEVKVEEKFLETRPLRKDSNPILINTPTPKNFKQSGSSIYDSINSDKFSVGSPTDSINGFKFIKKQKKDFF